MRTRSVSTLVGLAIVLCCLPLGAEAAIIGYWQFDDGTVGSSAGTLVTQVNSPGLDGTAQSSSGGPLPVFASTIPDITIVDGLGQPAVNTPNTSSLYFNNTGGVNSHIGGQVSVDGSSSLMKPDTFTVEAFIKLDDHVNYATILSKSRADAGGGTFTLDTNNNGTFRVRVDSQPLGYTSGTSGFNQGFSTSAYINDGLWHHVAVTYSNKDIDLFVDYVRVGGGTTINPIVYDDSPFVIGQGGGGRAFDGWIDEVRFSDTILAPDEFLRAVPEPSTPAMLLGFGVLCLAGRAVRRRRG